MSVSVAVSGTAELQRDLAKATGPELRKTLQKGTSAAAKFLKPKVVAETPKRTGRLRKSISAGQARRERPAAIVKARPKVAFYRHMVMGGTRPHRIRFPDQKAAGVPKTAGNIQHPGAKANPFIERVGEKYEREAFEVARNVIEAELP